MTRTKKADAKQLRAVLRSGTANEPPEGDKDELTSHERARILTRIHIEESDLSATAERVAIALLGQSVDGRVSTSEVQVWRIVKRLKADEHVSARDIDSPVLQRIFDDLLRAGVLIAKRTDFYRLDFGRVDDTIICRFMAWPHVITRPINAWFAVSERLPRYDMHVIAFYTYTEGELVVEKWARCFYDHSDKTWYESATCDRGLRLILPIIQNVTHWAEVESPENPLGTEQNHD